MKVDTYGIAHAMREMEIVPVEVMRGEKRPLRAEWERATLASSVVEIPTWKEGNNVGALWGEPSGWIIDVDLDCEDAVKAAHEYLPQTLTYGRETNPRSHHLFHCVGAENTKYALDPLAMKERGALRAMILEVRARNAQTVFVGSTHSGERVRWDKEVQTCAMLRANITSIEWKELAPRLQALAVHCGWKEKPVSVTREAPRNAIASSDAISSLIAEIANTPEGNRNNTLNLNAFKVFQRCHQEGLNIQTHAAMLMEAALHAGLTEGVARNSIESAMNGAAKNPRPWETVAAYVPPTPRTREEITPKRSAGDEVKGFLAQTRGKPHGDGIAIPAFPHLTKILHGLRGTCLFTGPTGRGKTTLVNTWAVNIASGSESERIKPVPVVFFTSEMSRMHIMLSMLVMLSHQDQRDVMEGTANEKELEGASATLAALEASGMLSIVDAREAMRGWGNKEHALIGLQEWVELLHPAKRVLVTIDSLAALEVMPSVTEGAFRSDLDNDAAMVAGMTRWSNSLPFGSCILGVHEESKARTGSGDTHAVRGSSKIAYRAAQIIALTLAEGVEEEIDRAKEKDQVDVAYIDLLVNKARLGGSSGSMVRCKNLIQHGAISEMFPRNAKEIREEAKRIANEEPKGRRGTR